MTPLGHGDCLALPMIRLLREKLSLRLAVLFLLASLVPAAVIAAVTLAQFERSLRADAERRQELLSSVVEDLFWDTVADADEKLTTVARLLASELEDREVGAFDMSNGIYRDTVIGRLEALVEPAGAFLELQYFASDFQNNAQFVALAQQRHLDNDPTTQQALIQANMEAPLVQSPVLRGAPYRDPLFQLYEGFPTLRLSRPMRDPVGTTGALLAYVDFQGFSATLERLAGEAMEIRVADGAGLELVRHGPPMDAPLVHRRDLRDGEGEATELFVEVAAPMDTLAEPLARLRRRVLSFALVAGGVAAGISLWFSTRVTRPIARLRRAAEALEGGALDARAGVERDDEIGALGAAFDRMAGALARLDAAKSEFLGNVSHELRTPLTSLRLTVANVLEGVTGEVPAAQREALDRVRRELDRLSSLVDDLLELARLEAGGAEPHLARVDLAALAAECVEALGPAAAARQVNLEVAGAGAVRGDAGMLRRVLWNLLDNAIKFSPPGGPVRVELEPGGLRVVDQGPGQVPVDAFERFRQGQGPAGKPGGAGLGLAIVARLVALQGGRVAVREDEGGTALEVTLEPWPEDRA